MIVIVTNIYMKVRNLNILKFKKEIKTIKNEQFKDDNSRCFNRKYFLGQP